MPDQALPYDSFLLVSFGGPEGPEDVMPFLENVLRGKNVPRERMLEVAEHYNSFGGVSPINQQNRDLLAAIKAEFEANGIDLPVYWGNRNWHPLFPDTLRQMKADGCKRTIAFFTSMFSCYSGCRQYRENIIAAQQEVGEGAPMVEKVRMGFNHPDFINTMADSVRKSLAGLGAEPGAATVLFTAHSIPMGMADNCDYVKQLNEASRLVAQAAGIDKWRLVYQSRSGPPQQPWLEPDVCDTIAAMDDAADNPQHLVIVPIGFVSDHMEVLYDLDDEAATLCRERGIAMSRAATPGTSAGFVSMIRKLVEERIGRREQRDAAGDLGPWHDACPADCCLYTPRRPPARA
ncbi:Ferrochelatase [Stieleria maiorica]|uniref:Ferrochelatase n=1 Tax=Stieleria maiorica TaxID=2795974 RepID=A0A5B9MB08_9BACT|nr:ferrochelatase [Stieleria maiorica]QEF96367.1 Ferrochelatase [Stieleria maiorica]